MTCCSATSGNARNCAQGSQPHHRRLFDHRRHTEQLRAHLGIAKQNGLTDTELKEAIIHLAFYAGWPKAMSAITVANEVLAG
jgi:alkylhydroperoxidase/carboxymuconolactone decarboxylase family protein YurZ